MTSINPYFGLPGIGSTIQAQPIEVLAGNAQFAQYLPGLKVLSATNCADAGNVNEDGTYSADILRAGNMLGIVTATSKYGSSVIGTLAAAVTTSSTSFYANAQVIAELARRTGGSGTFTIVGLAATNSTAVTSQTVTFSAATGTTITTTALGTSGAAVQLGALIMPADGSQTPRVILGHQTGVKMSNTAGTRADQVTDRLLIGGFINASKIVWYPTTGTVIQAWIKSQLRGVGQYFTFNDDF